MVSKARHSLVMVMMIGISGLVALASTAPAGAQEKKVVVKPSDLPASIRKAIKEAFPNGEIVKIQKEVEGDDPGQYDIDVRDGSKEFEVEVSPDGKIIEIDEKATGKRPQAAAKDKRWTESFGEEHCTFSTVGRNRFFILEPGHQLVLENSREKVTITVLDKTRTIGGIETRVVEEREEKNGQLKEVSRNFFAICKQHGDVFYFGEDVDNYRDGKIVKHSGEWRADEKNSKAGIIMPGTVLLGARHYQEMAPNAMDRAEVIGLDVTLKTPAGEFKNCLKVEETSAVEADDICYKIYAPGIGLIQDEDLLLTRFRPARKGGR